MNTNLTISEIVTIAVVILIVFGPHRLPEMARRAGEMLGKLRTAANSLKSELTQEYGDLAAPLKDIGAELEAAKADLRGVTEDMKGALPDTSATADAASDADASPEEGPPAGSGDEEAPS